MTMDRPFDEEQRAEMQSQLRRAGELVRCDELDDALEDIVEVVARLVGSLPARPAPLPLLRFQGVRVEVVTQERCLDLDPFTHSLLQDPNFIVLRRVNP